jgi:NAD(P)-dependent dehydrogenase (short-subunit alcohol dehydrogenase family)
MIQKAVDCYGRLDVLVNNAGIETRTSLLDTTEADFDKVVAVNLKSAFFGTQVAASSSSARAEAPRISHWSRHPTLRGVERPDGHPAEEHSRQIDGRRRR